MRQLVVFLKAPRAGEVKTRLGASIGERLAVEVYRALTRAVMAATRPRGPSDFARVVCFAPADARVEIAAWLGDEELMAQASGDLGHRMDQAFAYSFASGAKATVIIGTDSLAVDHAAVVAAFSALETADVMLRGARDGGYTLIGLRKRQPALFPDIKWSTGEVLAETLARAAAVGLRVLVDGPDADIDTADDLREQMDALEPHLGRELARRIREALGPPPGAFSTPDA
jgi:rSAM/selenodomain-associated transferase 1